MASSSTEPWQEEDLDHSSGSLVGPLRVSHLLFCFPSLTRGTPQDVLPVSRDSSWVCNLSLNAYLQIGWRQSLLGTSLEETAYSLGKQQQGAEQNNPFAPKILILESSPECPSIQANLSLSLRRLPGDTRNTSLGLTERKGFQSINEVSSLL